MSICYRAIKYRVYPTDEQKEFFMNTFYCCRFLWNRLLEDSIAYYKTNKKHCVNTESQYKSVYTFLKDVDSLALMNTRRNLEDAYKRYFNKFSNKPKFKSRKFSRNSYTTNNQHGTIDILEDGIRLPKVYKKYGAVRAKLHRMPMDTWSIKQATVSMDRDGAFYISVLFQFDKTIVKKDTKSAKAVGLDYKSDGLYMDSNGHTGMSIKPYRESEKRLKRLNKQLSKKKGFKKGEIPSKNFLKTQKRIAKVSRHASNQRKDFLHKLSSHLVSEYDVICIEDLNMRSLANKGFGNGKSTLDNGYGMFKTMLSYKLESAGGYLVKVGKFYPSSQLCSCCGARHPEMKISKSNGHHEYMRCQCGLHMQRDHNAAVNILNEGLRILNS